MKTRAKQNVNFIRVYKHVRWIYFNKKYQDQDFILMLAVQNRHFCLYVCEQNYLKEEFAQKMKQLMVLL